MNGDEKMDEKRVKKLIKKQIKKRAFWLLPVVLGGALLLARVWVFDATAAGEPYSVSLSSPVTFPVDI